MHELAVNESHVIKLDPSEKETMTVSLIDANHCPGAVMFLFQGYFGNVLYTGDFRYTPDMFVETPLSSLPPIDTLYLDNTYCTPTSNFPTRKEAKDMMSKIIRSNRSKDIVVGVRNLGKEDALEDLAIQFKTRIVVSQAMYDTLEILEAKDVFTTDPEAGFIYTVPFNKLNAKFVQEFNPRNELKTKELVLRKGKWVRELDTIAILPTALFVGLGGHPYCNCPEIHIVPYSDHSSYSELHEFVQKVHPKRILPVVAGSAKGIFHISLEDRADMKCFNSYLSGETVCKFDVPITVRQFMNCGPNASNDLIKGSVKMKRIPKAPIRPKKAMIPKEIEYTDSSEEETGVVRTEVAQKSPSENGTDKVEVIQSNAALVVKDKSPDVNESHATHSTKFKRNDCSLIATTSCSDDVNVRTRHKKRKIPLSFVGGEKDVCQKVYTIKDFFPHQTHTPGPIFKVNDTKPDGSSVDSEIVDLEDSENIESFTSTKVENTQGTGMDLVHISSQSSVIYEIIIFRYILYVFILLYIK